MTRTVRENLRETALIMTKAVRENLAETALVMTRAVRKNLIETALIMSSMVMGESQRDCFCFNITRTVWISLIETALIMTRAAWVNLGDWLCFHHYQGIVGEFHRDCPNHDKGSEGKPHRD